MRVRGVPLAPVRPARWGASEPIGERLEAWRAAGIDTSICVTDQLEALDALARLA